MSEPNESASPTASLEAPPNAAQSASATALARYGADLRRRRIVYFAVLAVLLAGVGTFVGVVWSRSEIAHATLHTFRPAPHNLPLSPASPALQEAWHTTDRLAAGVPQWRGTVITFSDHTVGGRDARTGARTWTYTRTDRTICTVGQAAGTTVAVFENRGNCDEIDAFYSGTGGRRWERTLNFDGQPINGRPAFQTTPFTFMITSDESIYAIDPVTGYNRWTYQRNGCHINSAVLGASGALISQDCSARVECAGLKFCRRGPQIFLRDGSNGRDDKSKDNPDRITWSNSGDRSVPVSADQVVTTAASDRSALFLLEAGSGKRIHRIALSPASGVLGPVDATATSDAEVLWLAGRTYALRPGAARFEWGVVTLAAPTVVSGNGESTPTLADARITVPTERGISVLDGADAHATTTSTTTAPERTSTVRPLGTGFLVGGPAGVVAYR